MRIYRADSFGLFDQSVFLMALQTGFLIRIFRTFSVRTVTGSAGHAVSNVAIAPNFGASAEKVEDIVKRAARTTSRDAVFFIIFSDRDF